MSSSRVAGRAVVNVVSKVGHGIIGVGTGDRCSEQIGRSDAIAHEPPIDLHRAGQHNAVNPVSGERVAIEPVIVHGDARPIRRIGVRGILLGDVVSRIHNLVRKAD